MGELGGGNLNRTCKERKGRKKKNKIMRNNNNKKRKSGKNKHFANLWIGYFQNDLLICHHQVQFCDHK